MEKVKMASTREGFGKALADLGDSRKDLVVLGADITDSVKTSYFEKKFPERFFSIGIAEQDAASTAAGMAIAGLMPVFFTYGVFASGRAYDQIRNSIAYPNLHVLIGGAHGGISVGPDGATHQALEELTLMRVLPRMVVMCPSDANETYNATVAAIEELDCPVYIRFGRAPVPLFSDINEPFTVGKAKTLREGNDITIIACGAMCYYAMTACEMLAEKGVNVRLINMHTIKPIDKEAIIKAAEETGKIITIEEHQVNGGLGSAVAEVIVQNKPVPMRFMGIHDVFGSSGSPEDLMAHFKLNPEDIVHNVEEFLAE